MRYTETICGEIWPGTWFHWAVVRGPKSPQTWRKLFPAVVQAHLRAFSHMWSGVLVYFFAPLPASHSIPPSLPLQGTLPQWNLLILCLLVSFLLFFCGLLLLKKSSASFVFPSPLLLAPEQVVRLPIKYSVPGGFRWDSLGGARWLLLVPQAENTLDHPPRATNDCLFV